MLEIKITIGADSSIERLADVLAKLVMAREGAKDAPADAGPLSPAAAAAGGDADGTATANADAAGTAGDTTATAAPEAKEVTMADMRAAVGPKLKELTEKHGPEAAKEKMRVAFEAAGAKEMNTSKIPQERRAAFIKAVEGLS